MVRAVLLSMMAAMAVACGGEGDDASTADDEANAARLAKALYVARPGQPTPAHDFLPAMSVGIDATRPVGATPANSVRFLYDYPGSPTRVSGACLGTWRVSRGTLELECASITNYRFKIVKSDSEALVLANEDGERFTLDRVNPEARGEVRAECDAEPFELRIDLTRVDGSRRAVFRVTPKADELQGQSPRGIFVLAAPPNGPQLRLGGTDLYEGEVTVTIPADPAGEFTGNLRYYDAGGPFQSTPKDHALRCRVAR